MRACCPILLCPSGQRRMMMPTKGQGDWIPPLSHLDRHKCYVVFWPAGEKIFAHCFFDLPVFLSVDRTTVGKSF